MKKLVLFLLLIAFVVPQLFSQIIPVIVSDNERAAVCIGNPTPLDAYVSIAGGGLELDGVDDYITTDSAQSSITNNFTFEAWVFPKVPHEFDLQTNTGTNGWGGQKYLVYPALGDDFGVNHVGLGISVGTNGVSIYEFRNNHMPCLLSWEGLLLKWTHIAVVLNDRQPMLYINGVLVKVGLRSTKPYIHSSINIADGGIGKFKGTIDEVRYWDRVRTPEEIAAFYNKSVPGNAPGLFLYWEFNEGSGIITSDAAVSANYTGKLVNAPAWLSFSKAPVTTSTVPTFVWAPATGLNSTTGSSVTASPSTTTTYTVTANLPNGSSVTTQAVVKVNNCNADQNNLILSSAIFVMCKGNPTKLNAYVSASGAGLEFDGTDDYINTDLVQSNVTNNFTFEAWVFPKASHEIDAESVTGAAGWGGQRYLVYPVAADLYGVNHVGLGISVGINGVSVYEHRTNHMPCLLSWSGKITEWTHIAVVVVDRQPHLYINGQLAKVGRKSSKLSIHPNLNIAAGTVGKFKGTVDEVRLWNRAKTTEEISSTYNKSVAFDADGLLLYWPMNEADGIVTADASGNGITGQILNGPLWLPASKAPIEPKVIHQVTWSPALGLDKTQGNAVTANPTNTTTYTVTANVLNQNPILGTIEITVNNCTAVPILTASKDVVIENANSIDLFAEVNSSGSFLEFDGIDDQVKAQDWLIDLANNFTYEFWIFPKSSHQIDLQSSSGTAGTGGQKYAVYPASGDGWGNGHVGMGVSVGSNGISVYEHAFGYMPPVLVWEGKVEKWTHIAVVYENRVPSLYVDGVFVKKGTAGGRAFVHPSLFIGYGGAFGAFKGGIDEVRIWERALNAEEIALSWNKEVGTNSTRLFCYWKFNDNSGTNIANSVSNGLAGILNNALAWAESNKPLIGPSIDPLFSWTPSIGLNAPTGKLVIASPLATTTYTVSTTVDAVSLSKPVTITIHAFGATGDYRTKASGNWNDHRTWQKWNGSDFVDAATGEFPTINNTVYLAAGHTVTLARPEACKDLNINSTADIVRLNTQENVLDVWGKIRLYVGEVPGKITIADFGIPGIINTGTNGKIRIRGNLNRIVMDRNEFSDHENLNGWTLECDLGDGVLGTINSNFRAGNVIITSGGLEVKSKSFKVSN